MTDPRLLTVHGQILIFDVKNSCVRATEDLNDEHALRLSINGSRGYLYYFDGKTKKSILIDHYTTTDSYDVPNASNFFNIKVPHENFVYLGMNGFFLSAEPSGFVNLKIWMEVYEKLWLYYDESCENLLLNNDWISSSLHRLVNKKDIKLRSNFTLAVGEIDYKLIDIAAHGHIQDGRKVHLLYDKYKIERLDLFRPLIYFCAYGGENSFNLLSMCVSSIEKYGDYTGDYMIVTDKNRDFIEKYVGFIEKNRLKIEFVPVFDTVDMISARFKIFNINYIGNYQPILYSDFDIVCNSSLQGLLSEINDINNIYVKAEGDITLKHYGSVLTEGDTFSRLNNDLGFNSGVIGFRHISDVELNFKSVVSCIYSHISHGLGRDTTEAYDQPVVNYVYNKISNYNLSLMQRHVHPWPPEENENITGKGLVHFCGGVGANHKFDRIKSYYEFLKNSSLDVGHSHAQVATLPGER